MSSISVPPRASSQCADEERRACGTDVPEPSTVSCIVYPTTFPGEMAAYQTVRRKAKKYSRRANYITMIRERGQPSLAHLLQSDGFRRCFRDTLTFGAERCDLPGRAPP